MEGGNQMSNTIDERIVDMQFNNSQFEQGVQESVKSLETLKNSLNLKGAEKSLNSLDEAGKRFSLSGIAESVKAVSDKFSAFGIIGITVLQNITNAAFNAGKRIASSLTIDPIKMGFSEYETQMNAVQTIMANTASKGTSLKDVNGALDELNEYADKTIYNFTEMTKNIGTFTAAGIGLNESVSAIKGIANLAAVSGSTSQQASVAMYQLSQALSSGTVRLMDWNSVVNAGMGGEVFKNALMETARVQGINVDAMIKKQGSFRESLQEGWLSSKVLTETLNKFTGDLNAEQLKAQGYTEKQIEEIMKLGVMANDAATKVKTFTQLIGTLKEAAQSGWAQSWRIIVGDFEEAKELMTEMSNTFGAMIGASADARNTLLQGWKDLKGRTFLIDSFRNVLQIILDLIKPISDAFKDIFPPITAQRLFDLTKNFWKLTEQFQVNELFAEKLYEIFKGLFSIVKIGVMAISALAKGAIELLKFFMPVAELLFNVTTRIAMFATDVKNAVVANDTFATSVSKVGDTLKPVGDFFNNIINAIAKGLPLIYEFGKGIGKFFGSMADKVKTMTAGNNFDPLLTILNGGLLAGVIIGLKKVVDMMGSMGKTVSGFLGHFDGVLGKITGILDGVKGSLTAWQTSIKIKTIRNIAISLGILALALYTISLIEPAKLATSLAAITVLFAELFGSLIVFEKLSGGKGFKTIGKVTKSMIALSISVYILAQALKTIADLNWEQLKIGLTGIGVILLELAAFMKIANGKGLGVTKTAGLILIAYAVNILADAVKKFGELSVKQLIKGVSAVGIILLELYAFMKLAGGSKKVLSTAVAVAILGGAMQLFAKAMKSIGEMSKKEIIKGLIGIGGALGAIAIAMRMMPKGILVQSIALIAVAQAIRILTVSMKSFGDMSSKQIMKSIIMLAGVLGTIAIAMMLMRKAIPGAIALSIIAASITVLSIALVAFSNMTQKQILKSFIMLAGVFAIIGIAGFALAPLIPALIGLAFAMTLFGVAALAVGAGVLLFSAGLTALAVSGTAAAGALVVILGSIISLIPTFMIKIGEGIIELAKTLANGAVALSQSIRTVVLTIINTVTTLTPLVVAKLIVFINTLLLQLTRAFPRFLQMGITLVVNFLNGIASRLPEIINSAYVVLISFINGFAEAIRNNGEALRNAVGNLILAIVEAFVSMIGKIVDLGKDVIDSIIKGVKEMASKLWDETVSIGKNIIDGVITGIRNMAGGLWDAATSVVSGAVDGIKWLLGIASPAKAGIEIGEFLDLGLIKGLKNMAGKVSDQASGVGQGATDAVNEAIRKIIDLIDEDPDFNPKITPVLDLGDFNKGIGQIDKDLNGKRGLNIATTISKARSAMVPVKDTKISTEPGATQAPTNNFVFNQNNYSPKELSRIDIYRQSKNGFAVLKGAVEGS